MEYKYINKKEAIKYLESKGYEYGKRIPDNSELENSLLVQTGIKTKVN